MDRRMLVSSARIHAEYARWELRILLCAYFGASRTEDRQEDINTNITNIYLSNKIVLKVMKVPKC